MIGWLEVITFVVLAVLAVLGIVLTVVGRPPDRLLRRAVAGSTALLLVQALIAGVRLAAGVRLPETQTFLIYLVVTVGVLPIALQFATAESEDEGPTRWGGAVVAVAAIALAVVELRLRDLWGAGG